MMKRFRLWLVLPLLLAVPLVWAMNRARQNPLYVLARYPQTPAFNDHRFGISSDLESGINDGLLRLSYASAPGFNAIEQVDVIPGALDLTKLKWTGRKWAGGYRRSDLSAEKSAAIQRLMRQLPPSSPPKNRDDLLLVIIAEPRPAQLRLYNRANLPQAVKDIYKITGAPLDELPR